MAKEVIVPTGAVHDLLGLKAPSRVRRLPSMFDVNLRRMNVNTPGPTHGVWTDARAVLKWMDNWNEYTGGNDVLEKMIGEFKEALHL